MAVNVLQLKAEVSGVLDKQACLNIIYIELYIESLTYIQIYYKWLFLQRTPPENEQNWVLSANLSV